MIYFVRAEQSTDVIKAGWIKIGTTIRLSVRLKQIADEIGHVPTILAVLDGGFSEERALHLRFSLTRRCGEWFDPCPALLSLIETDGQPWDEEDETPFRSIVSLKGSEDLEVWLDGLVKASESGTRTNALRRALRAFAEEQEYEKPIPDR